MLSGAAAIALHLLLLVHDLVLMTMLSADVRGGVEVAVFMTVVTFLSVKQEPLAAYGAAKATEYTHVPVAAAASATATAAWHWSIIRWTSMTQLVEVVP